MLREERINAIADYVDSVGTASLPELEKMFEISTNTLRRDIAQLTSENRLKKIYGGVTSTRSENYLRVFDERKALASADKAAIGELAVQLIQPNDLIFIDSGTTTASMASVLPTDFPYTVMTNSLLIINAAAALTNIKLMIVGSNFDRRTQSFIDLSDTSIFNRFNISKSFMAATGVSLTQGISNSEYNEFVIKKEVLARSEANYLLIDHEKFDQISLLRYGNLGDLAGIITDSTPPKDYVAYLKEHKISLWTAAGTDNLQPN